MPTHGFSILVDGASDAELTASAMVRVEERRGQPTLFAVSLSVDIAEGDIPLLIDDRIGPGAMLTIVAAVDDAQQCLAHGPVIGHAIKLQHGGDGSVLEVRAADSSIAMDRETKSAVWSSGTDADAVTSIVSAYGYVPDVDATTVSHEENKHALIQRDTDFRFVRRLAARNGCDFWVTAAVDGTETAHFRRPDLTQEPSAEVSINIEAPSTGLVSIEWDVERPTSVHTQQLDLNTKSTITGDLDVSPLDPLGQETLVDITGDVRSVRLNAPADDAGALTARAESVLIDAGFFVRASLSTSVGAAGAIVRTHESVNLRGAGSRHSGVYLADLVTHVIGPTAHTMEIELVRNAWRTSNGSGFLGGLLG